MKNDVVRWNNSRNHIMKEKTLFNHQKSIDIEDDHQRSKSSSSLYSVAATSSSAPSVKSFRRNEIQPISVQCDSDSSDSFLVRNNSLNRNMQSYHHHHHHSLSSSSGSSAIRRNNIRLHFEWPPHHSRSRSFSSSDCSTSSLASSIISSTIDTATTVAAATNRRTYEASSSSRKIPRRTYLSKFLVSFLQLCVVVFFCSTGTSDIGLTALASVSAAKLDLYANELDYEKDLTDANSWNGHYTHTWAVHVPNGMADEVARDHGFINLGKIFDDHYHFAHHKVSKRSPAPASTHQLKLENDHRVHWAKQQKAKSRSKRDFIRMRPSRTSTMSKALLVDNVPFNDPKWSQMWYLNRGGGLDMNVIPAWKDGITGKGVVVTILDDGLESDHPDIEQNYDPKASYDVNSHDEDPSPQYDMTDSNRHGTRCAGEVAATANNSICAVGIAYGASIGGVRMLDGDVTDAVEARSLSLNPQHIDIYSASWGPDDDGKTVDGPGELASRAFIEGVTKGRNGKGSIFIWASGNGGRELDNCNCDGYTNSIWTLSISSATEDGHVPWYSEKCSSTLATTYSSGGQNERQVVTTDLHASCTVAHTGTSASAPLAAGIAALVLESNRNLTWRDLQHIVVRTAKPANLKDPSWSKNGVGRRISHSFGYGLMDAATMVKVARTWRTVPEQQRCEINAPHVDKMIPSKGYITLQLTVKHCLSVNFLEHVQAKITLTSQRRGDIQLYLKSPAGTKVTLLTSRFHDVSRSGFNQWPFMSVHTWGESPHGNWQLEIHNEGRYMAQITQWDLIFYGTETPAQPDDPIQISPGQFGSLGSDIEHNLLEYDPDSASGQWRNMQQVGESIADVQHATNDRTNTACLRITLDQRCLECAEPTFIFDGRCYNRCPDRTYASLQQLPATAIVEESIQNSVSGEQNKNKEPSNGGYNELENGIQYTDQKRRYSTDIPRECNRCDRSCMHCYGPGNAQCSACFPGSQLRKTSCYAFAERSSGNSHDYTDVTAGAGGASSVRKDIALFLIIIIPSVILIFVVVFLTLSGKSTCFFWRNANKQNYVYDRVGLIISSAADNEENAQLLDNSSPEDDKVDVEDFLIDGEDIENARRTIDIDPTNKLSQSVINHNYSESSGS